MEKLRRLSWYERIKTGPSSEDDTLLQMTRELCLQLNHPKQFRYQQVAWGKFQPWYGSSWGMISKPSLVLGIPDLRPVELMISESLKGRLTLDEWKVLIAMHLVRFVAYNSGRMSKMVGKTALGVFSVFVPLLLFLPGLVGKGWASILVFPAWIPVLLAGLLWARRYVRRWEFELDRQVAIILDRQQVLHVLQKMKNLELEARPSKGNLPYRWATYWTPSSSERIERLNQPGPLATLPRPSRVPRISFRGRGISRWSASPPSGAQELSLATSTLKAGPHSPVRPMGAQH